MGTAEDAARIHDIPAAVITASSGADILFIHRMSETVEWHLLRMDYFEWTNKTESNRVFFPQ